MAADVASAVMVVALRLAGRGFSSTKNDGPTGIRLRLTRARQPPSKSATTMMVPLRERQFDGGRRERVSEQFPC
ncbi:unnamed protein product [Heligmosomoides polygyrus]|uniref:Secreted protein n=1 Tax=Heligmosomoides polygyrus TaxID=6339 RepID=A0A183GWF6_HELPZ|nr:unnamed protein product [Heligmosomoides polygyrus]